MTGPFTREGLLAEGLRSRFPAGALDTPLPFEPEYDGLEPWGVLSGNHEEQILSYHEKVPPGQRFLTPLRAILFWLALTGICVALLLLGPKQGPTTHEEVPPVPPVYSNVTAPGIHMVPALPPGSRQLQELRRLQQSMDISTLLDAALANTKARLEQAQQRLDKMNALHSRAVTLAHNLTDTIMELQEHIHQLESDMQHALAHRQPALATSLWKQKNILQSKLLQCMQALSKLEDSVGSLLVVCNQMKLEQAAELREAAAKHKWLSAVATQVSSWFANIARDEHQQSESADQVARSTWQKAVEQQHLAHLIEEAGALAANATARLQQAWERLEATRNQSKHMLDSTLQLALNWSESLAAEQLNSKQERLLKCQQHLAIKFEVPEMAAIIENELKRRGHAAEGAKVAVAQTTHCLREQEHSIARQFQVHHMVHQAWVRAVHVASELAKLHEGLSASTLSRQEAMQKLLAAATLVEDQDKHQNELDALVKPFTNLPMLESSDQTLQSSGQTLESSDQTLELSDPPLGSSDHTLELSDQTLELADHIDSHGSKNERKHVCGGAEASSAVSAGGWWSHFFEPRWGRS